MKYLNILLLLFFLFLAFSCSKCKVFTFCHWLITEKYVGKSEKRRKKKKEFGLENIFPLNLKYPRIRMRGIQPRQREQQQAKFDACSCLSFPDLFLCPRKVKLHVKQKEILKGLPNKSFPFCNTESEGRQVQLARTSFKSVTGFWFCLVYFFPFHND